MKKLIKDNGLAINKIMKIPGDTINVYHGTSAAYIDSILQNGLTENIENSYQNIGINYGQGIWVTLNYEVAKGYAIDSTKGFENQNKDSKDSNTIDYFGYGAIIEFKVDKNTLSDEGSASINNLKSKEIISPSKIINIIIFDINTNQEWNYFEYVATRKNKLKKLAIMRKYNKWEGTMKNKLIKQSEFYDAFKIYGEYIEIFKNATSSEINECYNINDSIRGIIDSAGIDYCWTGEQLHSLIERKYSNLNMSEFRFAYENHHWIFDANKNFTYMEIINKIIEFKDILSKYGNLNTNMDIFYGSDSLGEELYKNMRKKLSEQLGKVTTYQDMMSFENYSLVEAAYNILNSLN